MAGILQIGVNLLMTIKKLTPFLILMGAINLALGQVIHNASAVTFQNTETARQGVSSHLISNIDGTLLTGTQYKAELYYLDTTANSLTPLAASISSFKSTTATVGRGTWNGPVATLPFPAGYGGVDLPDDGTGMGTFAASGDGSSPRACD